MKNLLQVKVIIAGILILLTAMIVGFFVYWAPERTVKRNQAALFRAVEKKNPAKVRRLLSKKYKDRWGFTPNDISESLLDARKQFIAMSILREVENEILNVDKKRAVFETRLRIGGTPSGAGGISVKQQINRLGEPFVFTWEKETFLPSSWRLISLENPAIPKDVWGYEPGMLSEMIESADGGTLDDLIDSIGN